MNERRRTRAGEVLKNWRNLRGLSQIELAMQVGTSAKSLSFIENGRAAPAEPLLERLCSALGLDSRSRDLVRRSAGYTQTYAAPDLPEADMTRLMSALTRTAQKLEPCPAIVMDRRMQPLTANGSAMRVLHWLAGETERFKAGISDLSELCLSRDGLRPYLTNFDEVGKRILNRMYREISVQDQDGSLTRTYERWLAIDGVPAAWGEPPTEVSEPILHFRFLKDGHAVNLESLSFTVGTPTDLNYQEIRLRCFLPLDDGTRRFLEDLGAG